MGWILEGREVTCSRLGTSVEFDTVNLSSGSEVWRTYQILMGVKSQCAASSNPACDPSCPLRGPLDVLADTDDND